MTHTETTYESFIAMIPEATKKVYEISLRNGDLSIISINAQKGMMTSLYYPVDKIKGFTLNEYSIDIRTENCITTLSLQFPMITVVFL
jgi:hypothetical protein